MEGFGDVLRDNTVVSEELHHQRSRPVESLDAFLSHSWHQPRKQKFLQIAFLYHLRPAIVAGFLGAWLGFFLHWFRVIPVLHFQKGPQGRASMVIGSSTFILTFLCWGELMRLRSRRFTAPMVFLDKYCVNQEDLDEKKRGIKAIGATIARSQRLVVLHSQSYFSRLWTVYEVACFMSLHSLRRLSMIPEFLPKLLLIGNVTVFLATVFARVVYYPPLLALVGGAGVALFKFLMALSVVVRAAAAVVLFRRWATERERMRTSMRSFRIQDAQCFAETDRPLVQAHVAVLEKSLGLLAKDASEEEALFSFNSRVQEQLPGCVLQDIDLKYRHVVAMLLPVLFGAQDKLVGHLVEGGGLRKAALLFAADHVLVLFGYPLVVAFCYSGSYRCLHWRENFVAEVSFTTSLTIATSVMLWGFRTLFCTLNHMAYDSDAALVTYAALCVAAGAGTRRLWSGGDAAGRNKHRRMTPLSLV